MPFPIPQDPTFLREATSIWLDDIEDQLELGRFNVAEDSWNKALEIFHSLPVFERTESLVCRLEQERVKLDQLHKKQST